MGLSDSIYHHRPGQGLAKRGVLIYFVTGNPGLIDYYRTTLDNLFTTLCTGDANTEFHLSGTSLAGFDTSPSNEHSIKAHPVGLVQQIEYVNLRLTGIASKISKQSNREPVPVVLVGHSIGSYVLLEIISKWQSMPAASRPPVHLIGGICLFPTVIDIAKSPTGRRVAPLLRLPGSTLLAHMLVKLIFFFVPVFVMTILIRLVTRFEPAAAKATAQFLKSKHGIRQALYLARDEIRTVRFDAWSDSLWGIQPLQEITLDVTDTTNTLRHDSGAQKHPKRSSTRGLGMPAPVTRLYFYWGAKDHWVAKDTRDKLIKARGRKSSDKERVTFLGEDCKPLMEVDTNGIPHAFPIRASHSKIVAEKVAEWVMELIKDL